MATKKQSKPVAPQNESEIEAAIIAAQNELAEAHRSHASRELTNTSRLRELRVEIARLKTALRQHHYQKENE